MHKLNSSQVSGSCCHCCSCTVAESQFLWFHLNLKIFQLITSCIAKTVASCRKGLGSIYHPNSRKRRKTYSLQG